MNKLVTNARVTELDGLSDTLVRLYKANEAADTERDKAITALGKVLTGYAALPIPAKQAAAEPFAALEGMAEAIAAIRAARARARPRSRSRSSPSSTKSLCRTWARCRLPQTRTAPRSPTAWKARLPA